MKIIYWSDFTCPWCVIGEARLKKAIAALPDAANIELEMKAFQLNPYAGDHAEAITQKRLETEDGMTPEQARDRVQLVNETAQAEGWDFDYGNSLRTNTMDAHRLTKLAQSKGDPALAEKIIDALFHAYFCERKELADKSLLRKIAVDNGLDAEEVDALLASDQYKDEVILDGREAARYGIHGVPFFIIGRYGVSGAQSPEYLEAAILQAMTESGELKNDSGMVCGPDGCHQGSNQ